MSLLIKRRYIKVVVREYFLRVFVILRNIYSPTFKNLVLQQLIVSIRVLVHSILLITMTSEKGTSLVTKKSMEI